MSGGNLRVQVPGAMYNSKMADVDANRTRNQSFSEAVYVPPGAPNPVYMTPAGAQAYREMLAQNEARGSKPPVVREDTSIGWFETAGQEVGVGDPKAPPIEE